MPDSMIKDDTVALQSISNGDAKCRPLSKPQRGSTRSMNQLKKLAAPKFLKSGENPLSLASQRIGSKDLDLSGDPELELFFDKLSSADPDSSDLVDELVAVRPSRELSVTFSTSTVLPDDVREDEVAEHMGSLEEMSPIKKASYDRTVKALGLFEPNIPRKRISAFMLGWGARQKWDRSATDSTMRRWNAAQIHERKSFESSTIHAEMTLRAAVKHAESMGQKSPNSFTTAVVLGQLAAYLNTLSNHYEPFASTLITELLKAIYVNGNTTFEKIHNIGSKSGISGVCKHIDTARLYKRVTYHDAAKQLLARVDVIENEMQMYSEGVTLQTLIDKRNLAIRYGARQAVKTIQIMLFKAWQGYIERKHEKEYLRQHIKNIEEERHRLSEEVKQKQKLIEGANQVHKEAEEALVREKKHMAHLEADMQKMELDDVQERREMAQLRDDLRSQVLANERLKSELENAQALIKELKDTTSANDESIAAAREEVAAANQAYKTSEEDYGKMKCERDQLASELQRLQNQYDLPPQVLPAAEEVSKGSSFKESSSRKKKDSTRAR